MVRQARQLTAASLVMLILGITAGVGPGKHTCVAQARPSDSGLRIEPASEAHHLRQGDAFCVACLLKAQFSSLSLTVVPRVLPPGQGLVVGTSRVSLGNILPRRHWDARAPPHASSDSSTA